MGGEDSMSKTLLTLILAGFLVFGSAAGVAVAAPGAAFAAEKEGAAAANIPTPEFEYFQLDPLILPVISEKGITQQVSLVVALEVPYGKTSEISIYKPRLADAYIQALYGVLGNGYGLAKSGVVDVTLLKTRLTQVTTKILGSDKVRDVLLQVVQQRQM